MPQKSHCGRLAAARKMKMKINIEGDQRLFRLRAKSTLRMHVYYLTIARKYVERNRKAASVKYQADAAMKALFNFIIISRR